MMEDHEFCDTCPGCRPAMLDVKSGKPLPSDHPAMVVVNRVWSNDTTYAQRRAFIEVTLKNSRRPEDVKLFQEVATKIQTALEEDDNGRAKQDSG